MQERSWSLRGNMLTWKQALVYLVIVQYCVFGLHFINGQVFHDSLSILNQAVVITGLIILVYPTLAWARQSPWVPVHSLELVPHRFQWWHFHNTCWFHGRFCRSLFCKLHLERLDDSSPMPHVEDEV